MTGIDWNGYSSIAYICFGCIALISNTILLLSCVIEKSLWSQKKFYILVVSLAAADLAESFGYLNIGITQAQKVFGPPPSTNATAACVDLPKWSNLFSRTGGVASVVIHLIIAVERLLATAFPMVYFQKWKLRHVISLLAIGGAGIVGFLAFTAYLFSFKPYESDPTVCNFLGNLPDVAFNAFWFQRCSLGIVAVIVCGFIVILNHLKTRVVANDVASKRQAVITRTMLIITGIQFFLICIPSIIYLLVTAKVFECVMCEKSIIILGLTNSTVGLVVYLWTNSEMRKAIKAFVLCHRISAIGTTTVGGKSSAVQSIQVTTKNV